VGERGSRRAFVGNHIVNERAPDNYGNVYMSSALIGMGELSQQLGLSSDQIRELGQRERLPWSLTSDGFVIRGADLAVWKWAARRANDACTSGE